MGELTMGSITDDFNDCEGHSATTKHNVNGKRKGLQIRDTDDEQVGAKGVDVKREEEERVVRYVAELNPIKNRANPALFFFFRVNFIVHWSGAPCWTLQLCKTI